jgi:hydrogenase/urease accessory protein HupE
MNANPLTAHRPAIIATVVLLGATLAILFAMDRPPICTCGEVKLWHGVAESSGNSQHITDWYSPSHFIHGLIMYFLAWLLWVRWGLFKGSVAK